MRGEAAGSGLRWRQPPPWLRTAAVAAAVQIALLAPFAYAQTEQDRRNEAGIRMFGTLLLADVDLAKKADEGKLSLVIYYTSDARAAESLARSLRVTSAGEPRTLGGLAVDVAITNDPTFNGRNPAAIFLAQPPPAATLQSIIQYGIGRRIIVYSPFEGHVERGVAGGLSIGAQVKPYINASTLQASQISLKAIFMKVAKVYQ